MLGQIQNYQEELNSLSEERKNLSERIFLLEKNSDIENSFFIRQLKKKKLMVKDRITFLESQIYPNIIA